MSCICGFFDAILIILIFCRKTVFKNNGGGSHKNQ